MIQFLEGVSDGPRRATNANEDVSNTRLRVSERIGRLPLGRAILPSDPAFQRVQPPGKAAAARIGRPTGFFTYLHAHGPDPRPDRVSPPVRITLQ